MSTSSTKSLFGRLADLADQYWPHAFSTIGGIAMGYCGSGVFPAGYPKTQAWTFWIGATLFVGGTIFAVRQSTSIDKLRSRLKELEGESEQFRGDYFARLDTFLRITAEALGFNRTGADHYLSPQTG